MAQDISEVNHSLRYLDPNRHSRTSLFNWLSNGSLKSQKRVRPDAYSSHVVQKRLVKEMGENTDVMETFPVQHDPLTLVSSGSAFQNK